MDEDRMRLTFGWLKAIASDDYVGLDALATGTDMTQLSIDLAEVCLIFIQHHGDPVHHLDLMFRALAVSGGQQS